MDNLEEKIKEVLSDPEKFDGILSIAKNLGFRDEEPAQEAPIPIAPIMEMLGKANTQNGKQDALIHALLPYLRPERQKKLQRALRLAKLSDLAQFALKNYADQF